MLAKEPETVQAFFTEVETASGADSHLDAAIRRSKDTIASADIADLEPSARRIVERLALVLQASLLVRYGHPAVADAFCAARLGGEWGHAYGTLPARADLTTIVERATPKVG